MFQGFLNKLKMKTITCTSLLFIFLRTWIQEVVVVVQASYYVDKDAALENTAMDSKHVIFTSTDNAASICFTRCLASCRCMTFQICNKTECQLLSTNRFLEPSTLRHQPGCIYYDMMTRQIPQANTPNCNSETNCCLSSNPCLNGGTCIPSPATINNTRFNCYCQEGFHGKHCELNQTPLSCRGFNTNIISGKYKLKNNSGDIFETFCDFDDDTSMAWTLIQSYELQNKEYFKRPFYFDAPVNDTEPSWKGFRLSLPVMKSIVNDSTKIRATCNYEHDGVVYRDIAVALLTDIHILTYQARKCAKYEYIDIRGENCSECTAHTRQGQPETPFHVDVNNTYGARCDFYPKGIVFCGEQNNLSEDNFGNYKCINPDHRCSSSNTSTTQIWLGGLIQQPD